MCNHIFNMPNVNVKVLESVMFDLYLLYHCMKFHVVAECQGKMLRESQKTLFNASSSIFTNQGKIISKKEQLRKHRYIYLCLGFLLLYLFSFKCGVTTYYLLPVTVLVCSVVFYSDIKQYCCSFVARFWLDMQYSLSIVHWGY